MSDWLDQIKENMSAQLSKIYKDAKLKAPKNEWSEFESWFWKIKPHLKFDFVEYNTHSKSETPESETSSNLTSINEQV